MVARLLLLTLLVLNSFSAVAVDRKHETSLDYAQVLNVKVTHNSNNRWCFDTTVQHNDQGWEHYADEWKVVDLTGNDLGTRTLAHPHDNEQPFTRGKCGIEIPEQTTHVIIKAKCNQHGYGGKTIGVDLTQAAGEGYSVKKR